MTAPYIISDGQQVFIVTRSEFDRLMRHAEAVVNIVGELTVWIIE